MNHIIIKYPLPFNWTKTIVRKTAACWNELTEKELLQVMKLIDQERDIYVFRLKLLKHLMSLSWFQVFFLSSLEKVQLQQYFRWIEESLELTKTPFRKLNKFQGPPDELAGLTAKEFLIMDYHYRQYKEGKEEDLDCLIACMYRLRKSGKITPGHDARIAFDEHTVAFRARFFKNVNRYKKLAVLRYYESCRQAWEADYDKVFSGSGGSGDSYGWPEVFLKMAETGTFGSLQQVESTEISKIFLKMEIDIKDYEQFKRKNNF